jgi:hypothetical protein
MGLFATMPPDSLQSIHIEIDTAFRMHTAANSGQLRQQFGRQLLPHTGQLEKLVASRGHFWQRRMSIFSIGSNFVLLKIGGIWEMRAPQGRIPLTTIKQA